MRRMFVTLLPVLLLAGSIAPAQEPVKDHDDFEYLGHMIAWYRDATALGQVRGSSRLALYRDSLCKSSTQTLRSAFQFARAQAVLPGSAALPAPESGPGMPDRSRLLQAGATADQRIDRLQDQIEEIGHALETAPARSRAMLLAQRDRLTGELNLAKARLEALQGLLGLLSNPGKGGQAARINDLERSVTYLDAGACRAQADDFHPESAGVIGLVAEVFTTSRKMGQLDDLASNTQRLREHSEKLRAPMREGLRSILRRGDEISRTSYKDTAELKLARKELDGLLARFKQVSGASAPLVQQIAGLKSVESTLAQWRDALEQQNGAVERYLFFRLAMLGVVILIILMLSALWRRGTMRYVRDVRRRRQLLLVRRIVVGCTIAVFVLLSFVTEFGSLATFAGFSAAGIAVAMQSVLLSVVAYFFLVGRWGVRVGERISVSGTTGDVIDVGLFRVYLMELTKTGQDLVPTGRVVVFPNAIFFQPSALFKQFPGVDYTWRTVSFTLPPYGDYASLEREILVAVEKIYAEYRDAIERQHQAAQSMDNLHTPVPRPEARVRFVEDGLEFSVRYPVEIRRAGEIGDRVTRAVLEVLDRNPTVTFSRTPRVQAAAV